MKEHKEVKEGETGLRAIGCYQSIHEERLCQDKKWGEQNHDDKTWLAILMEEVGEVAMTILDSKEKGHPDFLRNKELIQVAAVVVAWMECLAKRGEGAKIWEEKCLPTPAPRRKRVGGQDGGTGGEVEEV